MGRRGGGKCGKWKWKKKCVTTLLDYLSYLIARGRDGQSSLPLSSIITVEVEVQPLKQKGSPEEIKGVVSRGNTLREYASQGGEGSVADSFQPITCIQNLFAK